ncbi:MAG: hypothetical protein KC457_31620 [Myxococcales bacterium]|nr:hypothetical protein [Myxococcales bacterium]
MTKALDLGARIGEALDAVLDGDGAVLLAEAYFDPAGPFAARSFHADGVNDPLVIGRDDLLAVTLLDVRFPPLALRQLLDEPSEASEWLADDVLPAGLCLWDAKPHHLNALEELRSWLMHGTDDEHKGVGYVIADKLAARKRPNLVPIIDRAVLRVIGPIGTRREFWTVLGEQLTSSRRKRLGQIGRQMRPAGDEVPAVRLLDALLWMHGSRSINARDAREVAGVQAHRP